MKMISWNVNGLRACLTKGFQTIFDNMNADIFALQEIKMLEGQAELALEGYYEYWNSAEKKGYSGTAVFSKQRPLTVTYGMGIPEHDTEGRVITLEYDKFFFVNCYTPNSKSELERLEYRGHWDDAFRQHLCALDAKKPVVICGDLNCAHQEIDLKHPKANRRNAGFTDEERAKFSKLLDSGFYDTFRHLYPEARDAYSWWSYRANAREKNVGWRIDYFLASKILQSQFVDAKIFPSVHGSDHCPVGFEVNFVP